MDVDEDNMNEAIIKTDFSHVLQNLTVFTLEYSGNQNAITKFWSNSLVKSSFGGCLNQKVISTVNNWMKRHLKFGLEGIVFVVCI